jgi:hypothetical protein
MGHNRKKKKKKIAGRQRRFGNYTFTCIESGWWKCGNLELWAWAGWLDRVWTKTWIFQYKKVIVEELLTNEWEKPFSTLGTKIANGGFDNLMKQIDKGKDPAVCGFVEIKEKPNSSLGHTHYFHVDKRYKGNNKRVTLVKIKRNVPNPTVK